jgi:hypothetical protein
MTVEEGLRQIEAYELSEIRITITGGNDVSSAVQEVSRLLRTTLEARDYSVEVSAR